MDPKTDAEERTAEALTEFSDLGDAPSGHCVRFHHDAERELLRVYELREHDWVQLAALSWAMG